MIHRPADSVPADGGSIIASLTNSQIFLALFALVKCIERYCSILDAWIILHDETYDTGIISQNANLSFEKGVYDIIKNTIVDKCKCSVGGKGKGRKYRLHP